MMQQITKTTLPDLSLAPLAAEPLQDTRGQASSRTRHDQSLRLTSSASSSHEDSKRSEEANLTTVLPTPSTTLPIQQHSGKLTSRQVEKLRSDSTSSDTPISQTRKIPWRPSIFRAAPLTGIAALLLAFLQVFASYAVLRASNGDRITNWKYQPTVYLAILTAISNKALAFATIQGTVVTFWLTALRGTTLGQMHRDWGYGLHVVRRCQCEMRIRAVTDLLARHLVEGHRRRPSFQRTCARLYLRHVCRRRRSALAASFLRPPQNAP